MLPAWLFGFLPGSPDVLSHIFLGLTHAFGDDHKSMSFIFPVCRSDALYVSTDLRLFVHFEHFSFEVLLRLFGFVSQGAIVDFDSLTCGCGTLSLGTGVSTGGRAHSPPAPWFSSFSHPVLVYAYVFWPMLPSTVSRLSCALVTWLSRESCVSLNFLSC